MAKKPIATKATFKFAYGDDTITVTWALLDHAVIVVAPWMDTEFVKALGIENGHIIPYPGLKAAESIARDCVRVMERKAKEETDGN